MNIIQGNALNVLRTMPDESVHCVVTSPPYWGLRDYGIDPIIWDGDPGCDHEQGNEIVRHKGGPHGNGVMLLGGRSVVTAQAMTKDVRSGNFCQKCGAWKGSYGLEPTPELYVKHTVDIFREVRRVLRRDGTLWLNMGDTYSQGSGGDRRNSGNGFNSCVGKIADAAMPRAGRIEAGRSLREIGIKPKDLCGMPWRVAFALQDDGWYLRCDMIWSKTSAMPESVTDRPSKSHEYIFLFSKRQKYFFDQAAVKEPCTGNAHSRGNGINRKSRIPTGWDTGPGGHRTKQGRYKQNPSFSGAVRELVGTRNIRSVWTINPEPYKDAHFATFPRRLPEICIKAGTSEKGCCPKCGKPWVRIVEKIKSDPRKVSSPHSEVPGQKVHTSLVKERYDNPAIVTTTGWRPTCKHDFTPVPCTVLDPFGGSGTTGEVARNLNRDFILVDLNPKYIPMQIKRIEDMFCHPEIINQCEGG